MEPFFVFIRRDTGAVSLRYSFPRTVTDKLCLSVTVRNLMLISFAGERIVPHFYTVSGNGLSVNSPKTTFRISFIWIIPVTVPVSFLTTAMCNPFC